LPARPWPAVPRGLTGCPGLLPRAGG